MTGDRRSAHRRTKKGRQGVARGRQNGFARETNLRALRTPTRECERARSRIVVRCFIYRYLMQLFHCLLFIRSQPSVTSLRIIIIAVTGNVDERCDFISVLFYREPPSRTTCLLIVKLIFFAP